jgi:small acid-soluble spore protein E (minor gamma-type SASP)
MAKQTNKTASGTSTQHVKQQNAQASKNNFGTEFGSETNVQEVKQQNAQAAANKSQNAQASKNNFGT